MSVLETCPCGSNQQLEQCCLPYHLGLIIPPNAEILMRSRYTAYVRADEAYLKATWHPDTLPSPFQLGDQANTRWLGLSIKHYQNSDPDHAVVEFVARYKVNGRAYRLHEVGRFVRVQARWYYLNGATTDD